MGRAQAERFPHIIDLRELHGSPFSEDFFQLSDRVFKRRRFFLRLTATKKSFVKSFCREKNKSRNKQNTNA